MTRKGCHCPLRRSGSEASEERSDEAISPVREIEIATVVPPGRDDLAMTEGGISQEFSNWQRRCFMKKPEYTFAEFILRSDSARLAAAPKGEPRQRREAKRGWGVPTQSGRNEGLTAREFMPKRSDEFYTFDEVLKELRLSEEELKKMVSEGELRAFKDEATMKFKKADVVTKRTESPTEPTAILPPGEMQLPTTTDDGVFIEEDTTSSFGLDEGVAVDDIQMPGVVDEAEVTTPIERPEREDIGATVAEEEIGATIGEEKAVEIPPGGTEEGGAETVSEELLETVVRKHAPAKPTRRITRFTPTAPAPRVREVFYPEAFPSVSVATTLPKFKVPVIFIALLGVVLVFLVIVGSFLSDSARISTGKGKYPVGLTREFGQIILDIAGIKDVNLDKFKKEE
ncbi:MAG: helix-turn-helix domain-containing protein [Planctomycetota bacterium]|nr:helix-turn-helix domain-containing protein [Planctomycetota bacterium]